jgi:hypothetical protein
VPRQSLGILDGWGTYQWVLVEEGAGDAALRGGDADGEGRVGGHTFYVHNALLTALHKAYANAHKAAAAARLASAEGPHLRSRWPKKLKKLKRRN